MRSLFSSAPACCIAFMLAAQVTHAQTWNTTGDNTSTGSLTIGSQVANSYSKLAILGPNMPASIATKRDISFEFNTAGKAQISSYRGGSWDTYLLFSTSGYSNSGGTPIPRMIISESGAVGINTTTPSSILEVATNSASEQSSLGIKQANPNSGPNPAGQPTTVLLYKWYSQPAASINFHRGNDSVTGFLSFSTEAASTLTERMRIDAGGNVGIGTTSTGPYKLAVEGSIGARKLKITSVTSWADFVFDDNYKLPNLPALKSYIQANRHLPDMPTASEVQTQGVDVAEMNAKLLQKVEELTLLLIRQDEAIKALQAQLRNGK